MSKQTVAVLFLALGLVGAHGDPATNIITNLTFWAQNLKFSLSGSSPGALSTNGIIVRTHAVPVKITSRDIIESLNGQIAYTLTNSWFSYTFYTTNFVSGPDIITTHYVTVAYPVHEQEVAPSYSQQAKLLSLQPLGLASLKAVPIIVIRDGNPAVDYDVTQYFNVTNVFPTVLTNDAVLSGKFDMLHDLVSVSRYAETGYSFKAPQGSPTPIEFNVGGYTTERVQSITQQDEVIAHAAVTLLNANVSGTGSNGVDNAFCVLRGTVSAQGGKLETKY